MHMYVTITIKEKLSNSLRVDRDWKALRGGSWEGQERGKGGGRVT